MRVVAILEKMEKKRNKYKFNITPENIIVEKLDDELVVGTLRTEVLYCYNITSIIVVVHWVNPPGGKNKKGGGAGQINFKVY